MERSETANENANSAGFGRAGVAVVGLGGCFPDAHDVATFWANICAGHVAIREVPADRWDRTLYFSGDRSEPDKTYSCIGGFLPALQFDAKRFRIPPRTLRSIDALQQMALTAVAAALEDAGVEASSNGGGRSMPRERTAVILGNAMGGEAEDKTSLRCWFPEARKALAQSEVLRELSEEQNAKLLDEFEQSYKAALPPVTEDSMPGELSNCITGRVANAFDLQGPNFTTDAACAASMAAVKTAVDGLVAGDFDVAIAGGADRSMDPPTYVKFSKIGALSGDISAPFDARANGFVMGEGVGVMVLKRLADAERDGDRIYAVIRGVGASSDGRGKGLTAPNPRGQRLAIERAYDKAGFPITTVGLFEAHGTSTTVGDSTELRVLSDLLSAQGGADEPVPIGSVKSMIGHLKSAAGAASLIKVALALHHKVLPPTASFRAPPEDSPLGEGRLVVQQRAEPWQANGTARRAGVSAFGFGGTNFHAVLEEYVANGVRNDTLNADESPESASRPATSAAAAAAEPSASPSPPAAAEALQRLVDEIRQLVAEQTGYDLDDLDPSHELESDLGIDTVKQAEILGIIRTRYGLKRDDAFRLAETPTLHSVASYVHQQLEPRAAEPVEATESAALAVAAAAARPEILAFGGQSATDAVEQAQAALGAATQLGGDLLAGRAQSQRAPARLTFVALDLDEARAKAADAARRRPKVLAAQGIFLSDAPPLAEGGKVAFLFPGQGSQYVGMMRDLAAAHPIVAETFREADEVLQPLIGDRLTDIVWPRDEAQGSEAATQADLRLRQTQYCQPAMLAADVAMLRLLQSYGLTPDMVAGHSLGEWAAAVAAGVLSFSDALYAVSARGREMAGVQVEDNGKMAVVAAPADKVDALLEQIDGYVITANKNCHSQTVIAGNSSAVEQALERFAEMGVDARTIPVSHAFHCEIVAPAAEPLSRVLAGLDIRSPRLPILSNVNGDYYPSDTSAIAGLMARQLASPVEFIAQIERMYADGARIFVEAGPRRATTGFVRNVLGKRPHRAVATNHHKRGGVEELLDALAALACDGLPIDFEGSSTIAPAAAQPQPAAASPDAAAEPDRDGAQPQRSLPESDPVVVSGASVVLPSARPLEPIDGDPFGRLLAGESFIEPIAPQIRRAIADKGIVRLNKAGGQFEAINDLSEVIQLAARFGEIDLAETYGLEQGFVEALDATARLAVAAGIDALRDAGLPLVRRYRTTSTGKQLPDRWALPPELSKSTGVILATAFPGVDGIIDTVSRGVAATVAADTAQALGALVDQMAATLSSQSEAERLRRLFAERVTELSEPAAAYQFNRKFLFRVLSLGHAQIAQTILAQGPNTQLNAACASGTQAIGVAQDWIRAGRCDRVLVLSADDITNDVSLPWMGAGFLAVGAATTEASLSEAAVPFGARRNGMIMGAGATGFVVEKESKAAERGIEPIVEVVTTEFLNSAFHGTRLDPDFIKGALRDVVERTATALGRSPGELARRGFFMSHETYTPARGGSAAAEVEAIRHAFGDAAAELLIANTKGHSGHPMGSSLEDVAAIKGLQRQVLPPVANLDADRVDPDFADLRFATGGPVDVDVAFRFGAGFGSQMALAVYRRRATGEARLHCADTYAAWLAQQSGRDGAGLEIVGRTLRVAESGGVPVSELGVPSLRQVAADEPDQVSRPSRLAASDVDAPQAALSEPVTGDGAPKQREPQSEDVASEARPGPDRAEVLQQLTALFAEQTGYDESDLEPTYELEADLGIDTVKQAELLSAVRERYGLARDERFKLADVQTLDAVADYVLQQMGAAGSADAQAAANPEPVAGAAEAPVTEPMAASPVEATPEEEEPLPAPAVPEVRPGPDRAEVLQQLTALFAEQTGYDESDLEPTYELEADLGIDTVKQAELLSAVRERYGLARDERFKLADVQTLDAVADYVLQQMGAAGSADAQAASRPESVAGAAEASVAEPMAASPVEATPEEEESAPASNRAGVLRQLTTLFAEQTGYDESDLEPTYELETDLGIDTVKQAEIFTILRERYGLAKDETFRLADWTTLESIATYVLTRLADSDDPSPEPPGGGVRPAASAEAPASVQSDFGAFAPRTVAPVVLGPLAEPSRSLAQRTVVVVASSDPDALVGALQTELEARDATVRLVDQGPAQLEQVLTELAGDGSGSFAGVVHVVSQTAATAAAGIDEGAVDAIEAAVEGAFATARVLARARDDLAGADLLLVGSSPGVFGFHDGTCQGAVTAALAGIAKSLAKEWPTARCLAADVDPTLPAERSARLVVDAWVCDGPAEVAWHGGDCWTVGWASRERGVEPLPRTGGETDDRPLVVATGGADGVTYCILLELARRLACRLVVLGRTEGVDPASSPVADRPAAEQKDVARAALEAAGQKSTPAAIRQWIERELRRAQIWRNLEALRERGCEATVLPCDLSDAQSLAQAASQLQEHHGRVDVLLHGAGIEESRMLADKDEGALLRTFRPKAGAALRLWQALAPRRMLSMGSVAGRFGNAGQADYAAANEVLAALGRGEQGAGAVLSVAWTAWDDVGMATRGSVRQVLQSSGVQLLPAATGARIGTDLLLSSKGGEVVVAGALGAFAAEQPTQTSTAEASGITGDDPAAEPGRPSSIFDRCDPLDGGAAFVRRLDPEGDLGLAHHRIDGVPVLPGVLGVELMARAAEQYAAQRGMAATSPTGLTQVRFSAPLKLHRDQPVQARVEVRPCAAATEGDEPSDVALDVILATEFLGPGNKHVRREHFTARAVFASLPMGSDPTLSPLEMARDPKIGTEDMYARYFHGPAFQVVEAIGKLGENGAEVAPVADRPAWLGQLGAVQFSTAPLLREAGFQAAGLWEMVELGRLALPAAVEEIRFAARPPAGAELTVHARCLSCEASGSLFDVWVSDEHGTVYDTMRGYRSITLRDLEPEERFEPAAERGPAPEELTVDIEEIQILLQRDPQGALQHYLSAPERTRFATLKLPKRREDWLAARVAAKRLLREAIFSREGAIVPYSAITIHRDPLGAPVVEVVGDRNPPPQVSMTHAGGVAVALLSPDPNTRVGIDVEVIEPRDPSFGGTFFTEQEQRLAGEGDGRDQILTELWAIKEATLKALGIGARVDFRDVEVRRSQSRWRLRLLGEARRRAEELGVGPAHVATDISAGRVKARVLLPVSGVSAKATRTPQRSEVSA